MPPCYIRTLTAEGLQPVSYTAESLDDAVQHEPDEGVYTVTNTYNTTQVLKLDAHLDRMEDSARREGIPLVLDRPALRGVLRQMIAEAGFGSVRFRITVPQEQPEQFIITLEPFVPQAAEVYESGVRCVTIAGNARPNPLAKTTDWMHARTTISGAFSPGIYDAFLLNGTGAILEGLGSNFYAILEGELRTAGAGVLPGIARQIVFSVAPALIPVRQEAVRRDDLPRLSEAFLTSSSRGIVPVVEIDGIAIGAGVPGDITKRLRSAYNAWVEAHLEEL